MSWEEPAAQGYHDVGQPAHDGGSHSSGAWSVERSFMLEGLAGQAASTGRRTGSCCRSCKSAISVGEAWWSGPLGLPQCLRLQTAPLHCTSASRQLLYTVPAPPHTSSTLSAGASRQLLYTVSWSVCDSSTSNPDRSARFCRGAGWGVREAGWKHE